MPTLEVPGAEIYYEIVGKGPLLLCITGAGGNYERWQPFGEALQDHFTVAMYDRRGFSRSYLNESQDYEHRLETDADDAALLIKHLSSEPATVIGNSSGALVSLMLLQRHPDVLQTLVSHEPPAMAVFPDKDRWYAWQRDVYDTYRRNGPYPAFEKFADMVGWNAEGLIQSMNPRNGPHVNANMMYWWEREFLQYVLHDIDLEALGAQKAKLMLLNGKETPTDVVQYLGNYHLSKKLDLDLPHICGAHIGFLTHAKQFAEELLTLLKKRDSYYQNI